LKTCSVGSPNQWFALSSRIQLRFLKARCAARWRAARHDSPPHSSQYNVLARFGSPEHGDLLYEVGVVIGPLLRAIFLADYFMNPAFRRELLRVLNRAEATNTLKRLI
jgi:hypothetical protein